MKKIFNIIIVIFIALLAGAGAYYYVDEQARLDKEDLNKQITDLNKQLSDLKASPSSSPSVSTTADPTANWKTYTNTVYDFSIKYPRDWKINSSMIDKYSSPREGFISNPPYLQIYQGTKEYIDNKLELELILTEANDLDSQVNLIEPEVKYSELKRITYNNIRWSFGTVYLLGVEPVPIIGLHAEAWARKKYSGIDNEKIEISVMGYSTEELTNIKLTYGLGKTFEQIISTFRFTK